MVYRFGVFAQLRSFKVTDWIKADVKDVDICGLRMTICIP